MSQLRQKDTEFESRNVARFLITFDSEYLARAYVDDTGMNWPVILDPDRKLYDSFEMKRGSFWDLYNPVSIYKYIKLMFTQRPGKPGSDWHQLGGDVLIDPRGTIQMLHKSNDPHDRPAPETILNLIDEQA